MSRVVHFEIHTDDLDRATAFYQNVFGWEITRWDGPFDYRLIKTGPQSEPGIDGALMKRYGPIDGQSVTAYVCTIDVANLDDSLSKALAAGATLAMPKGPVPGIGWLAYCKDTEGNVFGMMQSDPSAA
jgi:predicted enzyme related to lactoylglutathione lyase